MELPEGQHIDGPLPTKDSGLGTPLDELTPKQRAYVEARLQGVNPHAAARYACDKTNPNGVTDGTISTTSYEYERHPKIQAACKFVLQNGFGGEVTRETVLDGLRDAVECAANSAELTAAWREIGRVVGAYAPDRTEVLVKGMTHDDLKTVSDRELLGIKDKQSAAASPELLEAMDGEFEVLADAVEEPQEVIRGGATEEVPDSQGTD